MTTDPAPASGLEAITNVRLDEADRRAILKVVLTIVGTVSVPLIGVSLGMWRGQAQVEVKLESLNDKVSAQNKQIERIENRLDANEARRLKASD